MAMFMGYALVSIILCALTLIDTPTQYCDFWSHSRDTFMSTLTRCIPLKHALRYRFHVAALAITVITTHLTLQGRAILAGKSRRYFQTIETG